MLQLDRLARRSGTDVWEVVHWPPARVSLAILAMVVHDADMARRLRQARRNKAPITAMLDVAMY